MYMNGDLFLEMTKILSHAATDTDGSEDYADDVCSVDEEAQRGVSSLDTCNNHLVDPDVPLIEQE